MKKLNLQLGSIKEMLTKEQMKKVNGGYLCGNCIGSVGSWFGDCNSQVIEEYCRSGEGECYECGS